MSKFYITTSIAYVNAAPHLGFALELVQADVIARWHRQKKDEVFFLTGADEHGAKITRAAEAAGKEPRAFVDENTKKFQALKDVLHISWDDFIRTSDVQRHWPQAINLWNALVAAGDIYKKPYRGLYCVGHEAFITEKDLINGKCKDHDSAPEALEEENYFFRLSKYALPVAEKIKNGELAIIPKGRAQEILNFIDQGIEDISFSRPRKDLAWGIPVPGDDAQTMYVWADALANYLYPKNQWPADVHCIGKDILRFHALYWPAMLLSAGLPLPKTIFVHGHITIEGQKMSKTLGNIIDPVALVEKYGVDAVRYYVLREIPPTDDGDFSHAKFEERYNADLVNGLGNFVARVAALTRRNSIFESPPFKDWEGGEKIIAARRLVDECLKTFKFHEALRAIGDLVAFGDKYCNERKPWDTAQDEKQREETLQNARAIVNALADVLIPFLPATAEKIRAGKTEKLFPRLSKLAK